MATVYSRSEIERVIDPVQVIAAMEQAFSAYSRGEAVIPPVGQLDFDDPPGACHIKYGYLAQGTTFTVKIATGFWKNPERGLPSSNGLIQPKDLIEIGRVIEHAEQRRKSQNDLTIADLTGVAVQDIAIAELALHGLQR